MPLYDIVRDNKSYPILPDFSIFIFDAKISYRPEMRRQTKIRPKNPPRLDIYLTGRVLFKYL